MVQSTGANVRVMVDTEATFKMTPGVPNGRIANVLSSTVTAKRSQIQNDTLRSNRQPLTPTVGNLDVSGSISSNVDAEMFGFFLSHLLGAATTTGVNPYVHVFKAGGVLPAGMVIEHDFTDQVTGNFKHMFNGCRVNQLSLTLPQEGFATAAFDILGSTETTSAVSFDTTPTDLGTVPFSGFEASILEGGVSVGSIAEGSITVSNNLDGGSYTIDGSGGTRSAIPEGSVTVTGNIRVLFDSMLMLDKATNQTTSSLQIDLARGNGLGSAGNESVSLLVQELRYEKVGVEVSGAAGIFVTLNFTGFFEAGTAATAFQTTIKNAIAAY